ncbi:MAG TPA: efflux RND transporter periplasmic adaptor subunit [Terriglobia bacterium]|nr:efflux RND transporter periplasmic adaptor subunit [Terriglobia bacterium]
MRQRNSSSYSFAALAIVFCLALLASACSSGKANQASEAPPPARVERESDANSFRVDHPEQFPLASAAEYDEAPELKVTAAVSPDISRNVPVISIASGRVLEIDARLGDTVHKGQVLMRVQSADISQAFSDYRQALADETLAHTQLDRSQLLYGHGAIALNDLQVAQDTEEKAKVTVDTTLDHLRVLGADSSHPSAIIDVRAPVSGVITDQQVTAAAGTQGLASPNAFTISDLSQVWILCDVYENDLPFIRLGEYADIRLNAYPDVHLKGRIANIGPILDPNLRTAKVRLEVANPGMLRLGMFATATFHGPKKQPYAVVPAGAVLHLHDRDWVYTPAGGSEFHRLEVTGGKMLPGNAQEITSGLKPGQQVVANALDLQSSVEQ